MAGSTSPPVPTCSRSGRSSTASSHLVVAIKRGQRPLEAGDSWSIDTAPGRVLYGAGVIDLIGEVVRELGGRRVLVVADPGVAARATCIGRPFRCATRASTSRCSTALERTRGAPCGGGRGGGLASTKRTSWSVWAAAPRWTARRARTSCSRNGGRMEDYWGFGKAKGPMLSSVGVPARPAPVAKRSPLP